MRELLFLLIMAGTIPLAFGEPFIGLMAYVILSDMNPYRMLWGVASEFHWVLIMALVTLTSMFINRNSVQKIHWTGLSVAMLLFTISATISTAVAMFPAFAYAQWIMLLKMMLMVVVIIMLVNNTTRAHWMIWVFVVSIGFWAVKGGIFTVAHGGNYHVYGPPNSFIADNNQLALAMCMVLPLMRYLQLHSANKWIKRGFWIAMALTVAGVFGTYSRGGLITVGVVLVFMIMKSRKRAGILIAGILLTVFAANFLPSKWMDRMDTLQNGKAVHSNSFDGRINSWEFATNVAIHRPFTGGGFGVWAWRPAWDEYGPPGVTHALAIHSIWFKVMAEQGITGLVLYVLILGLGWRTLARIRKKARGDPETLWLYDMAGYLQVSLVAYAVAGSALPLSYFNLTFQLLGFIVALDRIVQQQSSLVLSTHIADIKIRKKEALPEEGNNPVM